MKLFVAMLSLLFILTSTLLSATVDDSEIEYIVDLPENWAMERVSATHHYFYDTTATCESIISIVVTDFSSDTIFSSANEWTRANFIAYAFSVDADPFSVLVFSDTVSVKHNDVLWATDAYAYMFSTDTAVVDYAEYVRYTASGSRGFELYAIGPMADMDSSAGYYAAIMASIELKNIENVRVVTPRVAHRTTPVIRSQVMPYHDLLGRKISSAKQLQHVSRIAAGGSGRRLVVR